MKKLGIVILVILTFFGYKHYKLSPPDDMIDRLEEIRASFRNVYDKAQGNNVTVDWSYLSPSSLSRSDAEEVRSLMKKAGVYQVRGACDDNGECYITAYTGKLPWLSWFGSTTNYYSYGNGGIIDAEFVDDVEKAVETNGNSPYAFCESTESKHWFYCESNI